MTFSSEKEIIDYYNNVKPEVVLTERKGGNLDSIKALMQQFTNSTSDLLAKTRLALDAAFQSLADNWPDGLKCVGWTQYTPGFNDGDPCVFGLGEIFVQFEGDGYDGDQDIEAWEIAESNDEFREKFPNVTDEQRLGYNGCIDATVEILSFTPNQFLQSIYGDGVRVKIMRNEDGKVQVEVEDYDCGY